MCGKNLQNWITSANIEIFRIVSLMIENGIVWTTFFSFLLAREREREGLKVKLKKLRQKYKTHFMKIIVNNVIFRGGSTNVLLCWNTIQMDLMENSILWTLP